MKYTAIIFSTVAALWLAGCAATDDQETKQGSRAEALEAEIKAKQGEPVRRVCFTRSINGWRALGRKSLLLSKGVNDWYKLDLVGTCDPKWAFDTIAIQTRPAGASCLTRGDRIATPDRAVSGNCVITDIYRWDDKAE